MYFKRRLNIAGRILRQIACLLPGLICFSCGSDSARLEYALKSAGGNRPELEKVLKFYSCTPKDSLKYRAACFLISNMPKYYSYSCERFEKIKTRIYPLVLERSCSAEVALEILEKEYGQLDEAEFKKVYDVHVITAKYLIDNIEWAFRVWEENPWGKNLSFGDFCEEILPYRVGDEPLENWREKYYNTFRPLLDKYYLENSLEACKCIYDKLSADHWQFEVTLEFPHLGANTLLEHRYGECLDRCDLVVYAMRAVGIPCGIDLIIQAPEKKNPHHYWNYMRDENGTCIDFALVDMIPSAERLTPHYKRGKVFRQCYGLQKNPLLGKLKGDLNDGYIKDVSKDYFPKEKIGVLMNNTDKIIYLNVFNNREWIPVGYTKVKDRRATFGHLEPGIMYMLTYYEGDRACPVDVPLMYQGEGVYDYTWADTTKPQALYLDRKYPYSERTDVFRQRLLGGKFQAANKPDFSDSVTLYTIRELPALRYHNIPVTNAKKFKYFRYLSGKGGCCDMGEIEFLSREGGCAVKGRVIGGGASFLNDPKIKREAVFDGDPLTYFSAHDPDNAWVGIEAEKPVSVTNIRYIGRNDDNGVRTGDIYELFYFSNRGKWVSLGQQTGGDSPLCYKNAPAGATFWLRDLTRGEEERIFTYEDGRQVWW